MTAIKMAAGVSIDPPNSLFKGLIITSVLALVSSFMGVPYNVENLERVRSDPEVSEVYSIHRARRQVPSGNSTIVSDTNVTTTSPPLSTNPTTNTTTTTTTQQPTSTTAARPVSTTRNPLLNAKYINDSHKYYSSSTVVDKQTARNYWVDLDDISIGAKVVTHKALSAAHRTAATVTLKFDFPFYGHTVRKVTIATGGFLYVSDFIHRWLTATQYIAPLMANFDTRIGQSSNIKYLNHDAMMVAQWEDVYLQDEESIGSFTFQVTIHKNGKIVFGYKKVPKAVHKLSTKNHPVKIGVSDAYYSDRVVGNVRRRTIVEYHRVTIKNDWIEDDTAVVLLPAATCISITDCNKCATADINFKCAWCGRLGKCSDGMDRYRQMWYAAKCTSQKSDPCPAPKGKPNPQIFSTSKTGSVNVAAIVVILLIIVVLIGSVVVFVIYAYKNPNSRAGIWLIEHRPSKIASSLRAKVNSVRGKDSSSGDKYAVSVTPGTGGTESRA